MTPRGVQPIREAVLRAIVEQAEREAPRECCGLLAGARGVIERHWPLPNVSPRPESRFFADPAALLAAHRELRDQGCRLLGIYHSHPVSAPIPSPTDVAECNYPQGIHLIVGPPGAVPRWRAYRIEGEEVTEIQLQTMAG